MNKFVIIRDMSAGNESVGEMWQETKIFDGCATLDDVMEWAMSKDIGGLNGPEYSRKRIQITKPHESPIPDSTQE